MINKETIIFKSHMGEGKVNNKGICSDIIVKGRFGNFIGGVVEDIITVLIITRSGENKQGEGIQDMISLRRGRKPVLLN